MFIIFVVTPGTVYESQPNHSRLRTTTNVSLIMSEQDNVKHFCLLFSFCWQCRNVVCDVIVMQS